MKATSLNVTTMDFTPSIADKEGARAGSAATPGVKWEKCEPEVKDSFFIPFDMVDDNQILAPPSPGQALEINRFAQDYLHICESRVHGRGVKYQGRKDNVEPYQIVAIYHGQPLRMRQMTDSELTDAGLKRPGGPTPYKWLSWHVTSEGIQLCQRLSAFEAMNENIIYSVGNHSVVLGIDAIDSPSAISNINCATQEAEANIILVPCIDPAWLQSVSGDGTLVVSPGIPDDAYMLLAVADKAIEPGDELLLDYSAGKRLPSTWQTGRDFFATKYFHYPNLCHKNNIAVCSVEDNKDVMLYPCGTSKAGPDPRQKILKMLRHSSTISEIAFALRDDFDNPLTDNRHWCEGDVIYYCQLMHLPLYGDCTKHLTYLLHCMNDKGELDNIGKCYLAAVFRSTLKNVDQPDQDPKTLPELLQYIEAVLLKLREQADDPVSSSMATGSSETQKWLSNELSQLKQEQLQPRSGQFRQTLSRKRMRSATPDAPP